MKIINVLKSEGEISVKELKKIVPTASNIIRTLERNGRISIFNKRVYRDPFGESIIPDKPLTLTKDQQNVFASVSNNLGRGFSTFLLAGVTGSGKTEIYMQLAAEAIQRGYSVIVLVPEIALISQMEKQFRARFGACVAVLHSGLSAGERLDQWIRILKKEASIAIGARSAIFAPLENIGIIIVDEEHDPSYKQEGNFAYNARDLAIVRAQMQSGISLLGSATPSMQSYHNALIKKFTEVSLKKRIEKRPLPEVIIVDLRKTRDSRGNGRFFTPQLQAAIQNALDRGEQIILFLNRRGFASFPVCAACGAAIKCNNCDISLTMHKRSNVYKCHLCGFKRSAVSACLTCGSTSIKQLGFGTEKIEAATKALFPNARVTRMDHDTTRRKGSILKILKGLKNQTIDILIGTQMVTKGHDFPYITTVGIICADLSLNFPDFRAGERTFQLIAQAAGRAGRGRFPGKVILQTYNPRHYSILAAKKHDFKTFYHQEIHFRKSLNYPPFSRIVQLKISGRDKDKTKRHAGIVGNLCIFVRKNNNSLFNSVEILGPVEAPITRIARHYRWQILLKCSNVKLLHKFVDQMLFDNIKIFTNPGVKVVVDVDPFFMM